MTQSETEVNKFMKWGSFFSPKPACAPKMDFNLNPWAKDRKIKRQTPWEIQNDQDYVLGKATRLCDLEIISKILTQLTIGDFITTMKNPAFGKDPAKREIIIDETKTFLNLKQMENIIKTIIAYDKQCLNNDGFKFNKIAYNAKSKINSLNVTELNSDYCENKAPGGPFNPNSYL